MRQASRTGHRRGHRFRVLRTDDPHGLRERRQLLARRGPRSSAAVCPIDVALLFAGACVVPPLEAVLTLTAEGAAEAADISTHDTSWWPMSTAGPT